MWRWLLNSKHSVQVNERQYLMDMVRTLVYAKTELELKDEYSKLIDDSTVKKYSNSIWKDFGHAEGNGLHVFGLQQQCTVLTPTTMLSLAYEQ
jgi:hypothetical protein